MQEDTRTFSCGYSITQPQYSTQFYALDTLYLDLAKYTETPVSKVKMLLQYWFDKAFWHRPTVVIMDNLDKLMGIEQEVRALNPTACSMRVNNTFL